MKKHHIQHLKLRFSQIKRQTRVGGEDGGLRSWKLVRGIKKMLSSYSAKLTAGLIYYQSDRNVTKKIRNPKMVFTAGMVERPVPEEFRVHKGLPERSDG